MIHYHGTPITPKPALWRLSGKHFCVSMNDPRDVDWCLAHGQSVLFDSGAFTVWRRGGAVKWSSYFEWLESRLAHPHWAIVPDVIDGTEEQQRELIKQWPFGFYGAPVWHMDLSIEWLIELSINWPRVCFGSSGKLEQVGSDAWRRKCDQAFNALALVHGQRFPWIHMLRGLSLCGDQYPFASADSANVARNFKDRRECPEIMARNIDRIQCPSFWSIRSTKKDNVLCFPQKKSSA